MACFQTAYRPTTSSIQDIGGHSYEKGLSSGFARHLSNDGSATSIAAQGTPANVRAYDIPIVYTPPALQSAYLKVLDHLVAYRTTKIAVPLSLGERTPRAMCRTPGGEFSASAPCETLSVNTCDLTQANDTRLRAVKLPLAGVHLHLPRDRSLDLRSESLYPMGVSFTASPGDGTTASPSYDHRHLTESNPEATRKQPAPNTRLFRHPRTRGTLSICRLSRRSHRTAAGNPTRRCHRY